MMLAFYKVHIYTLVMIKGVTMYHTLVLDSTDQFASVLMETNIPVQT